MVVAAAKNAFASLKGNEPRFLFSDDNLEVLSFSGSEGISEIFNYNLELVSEIRDLGFEKYVGKQHTLMIIGADMVKRFITGIITRFEAIGFAPKRTAYRAVLAAPQAKLLHQRRLRIFQDMTTKQIVEKILGEAGIAPLKWKLRESYDPRNYCVQYRETDFEFISRLLEEDGIAYHFEHVDAGVTTVFTDHQAAFDPIVGEQKVAYNADTSMVPDQEFVSDFIFGEQIRTGKVELRDFDFRKPNMENKAIVSGKDPSLELYDYPGEFIDQGLGERLANVRLQEFATERQLGSGGSSCIRFIPGFRFTLGRSTPDERHPRKDLNQEYLLLRVSHSGSQPQVLGEEGSHQSTTYTNSFQVMPFSGSYRPPRVTPRPIAGNHTATVVGPKGEEIYVDKLGRVKVQFHWDREGKKNESSSCWIRVVHNWAGTGYGGIFIPRIGQEVLVSFLEGDPDRPLVTGRIYNGVQNLPYELPANKTRSSIKSNSSPGGGGFNEIRFEDKKGAEEIFIHAQLDYNIEVLRDRTSKVTRDRKENIGRDQEVHVKRNSTHTANVMLWEARTKITLKVGSSTIVMTPTGITIQSPNVTSTASVLNTIKGALVKIN